MAQHSKLRLLEGYFIDDKNLDSKIPHANSNFICSHL